MSLTNDFPFTTASNSMYALEPIQRNTVTCLNKVSLVIYMDMYVHVYVVSLYYNSSTFNCLRIKNNYLVLSIPYPQEVHVSISITMSLVDIYHMF